MPDDPLDEIFPPDVIADLREMERRGELEDLMTVVCTNGHEYILRGRKGIALETVCPRCGQP